MKRKKDKRSKKIFYQNKATLAVYLVLRGLVILSLVRAALRWDFQSVFLCGLTLILLILPSVFTHRLRIELPTTLEIIILLFIFAAEILGEIQSFYTAFPHWATRPHFSLLFICLYVYFFCLKGDF